MTLALFEFEDVLVRRDYSPIPLGLVLLRSLKPAFKIAITAVMDRRDLLDHWLMENGFPGDFVSYRFLRQVTEANMDEVDLYDAHVELAQSIGPVELAVTAAPAKAARSMHRHVTTLLFASPATARPEYRPGHQLRGWADIEEEMTSQRILKTKAGHRED